MPRTPIPFQHPDVSQLARHLERHLATKPGDLKHSQVLNVLASSLGYRSHAALKALGGTQSSTSHLVALEYDGNNVREVFARDDAGEVLDRRRLPSVDDVRFLINVSLELGSVACDLVLHVVGRGQSWSFTSDYIVDEERLVDAALSALKRRLLEEPLSCIDVVELGVSLPKFGGDDESHCGPRSTIVKMRPDQFLGLQGNVRQAAIATQTCELVVKWLQDAVRDPEALSVSERPCLSDAAAYLDAVIEVSGEPFMASWNHEKMAGIGRSLRAWAAGSRSKADDREYAFRNLMVFNPPLAWTGVPPRLSDKLESVLSAAEPAQ